MEERELLESLRPHLVRERIVPPSQTGPVRYEALKTLARKWNLHKEPGFWRQYNKIEKLARVLAAEAQSRRRYRFKKGGASAHADGADGKPSGGRSPRRTTLPEWATAPPTDASASSDVSNLLSPYQGDVFGTKGDYSSSLVYLSRRHRNDPTMVGSDPLASSGTRGKLASYRDQGRPDHLAQASPQRGGSLFEDAEEGHGALEEEGALHSLLADLRAPSPAVLAAGTAPAPTSSSSGDLRPAPPPKASTSTLHSWASGRPSSRAARLAAAAAAAEEADDAEDSALLGSSVLDVLSSVGGMRSPGVAAALSARRATGERKVDQAAPGAEGQAGEEGGEGGAADARKTSLRQQCALALRDMSGRKPAARRAILAEGAMPALLRVLAESPLGAPSRLTCVTALANLSAITSGDPRFSLYQERIPPPPHVPKRKGGSHARRVAAAAASVGAERPSQGELNEVAAVVAALCDVGKGLSLNLGDDAEAKLLILTSLFNFTCHRAYRRVLVASGGVKAVCELMAPVIKTHVKAGLVQSSVPEELAALVAGPSPPPAGGVRDTVQGARLALVDAFSLAVGVKALCNISGCWQGTEALLGGGVLEHLSEMWDWFTHEQRCALGAHVLYNMTRSRSYIRRAAEECLVPLLRSVVHATADAHDAAHAAGNQVSLLNTFALRRSALALARMAAAPTAEVYLAHCGAAAALARVALIHMPEHLPLEDLHAKPQVGVPLTPQAASEAARRSTMLQVSAARGRLGKGSGGSQDTRPPSGAAEAPSHPGVPTAAPDSAEAPPAAAFDMEYSAGVALVTSARVVSMLTATGDGRSGSPVAGSPGARGPKAAGSIVPADRGLSLLAATLLRRKVAMALARVTWRAERAGLMLSQHGVATALAVLCQSDDGPTRKVALTAIVNAFKSEAAGEHLLQGGAVVSLAQLAGRMVAGPPDAPLLAERPLVTQALFNMSCHRTLRGRAMGLTQADVDAFVPDHSAVGYTFQATGRAEDESGLTVFRNVLHLATEAQGRLHSAAQEQSAFDAAAVRASAVAAANAVPTPIAIDVPEDSTGEEGKVAGAGDLRVRIGGAATFGGGIAGAREADTADMTPRTARDLLAARDSALEADIDTVNKKQWVLVDGTEAPLACPEPAVVLSFALATLRNLTTGVGWEEPVLRCEGLLPLLRSLLQPGPPRFAPLQADAPFKLHKPPILTSARGQAQPTVSVRDPNKALAVPVTMALQGTEAPAVDIAAFNMSGTTEAKEGEEGDDRDLSFSGEAQGERKAPGSPTSIGRSTAALAYPTCGAPLACLADAIGVIANLSLSSSAAREIMVHEGLLALLIPIATSPMRSMLVVAYAQSVHDVERVVGERLGAATRMADMAIRNVQVAASELKGPTVTVNTVEVDLAAMGGVESPSASLRSARGSGGLAPSSSFMDPGAPPASPVTRRRTPSDVPSVRPESRGGSLVPTTPGAVTKPAAKPAPPAGSDAELVAQVSEHSSAQVDMLGRTATVLRNQCAIALSAMATDTADSARLVGLGVMEALVALCTFTRDGDPIRHRVTAALRSLSEDMSVSTRMVYNAHAVPVAVDLCGSSMGSVRREAVGLLYNLSRVENAEDEMVEAGVVPALLVIALIKNSDPITQATCIETLHNLMASPMVRLAVLHQGVIWALQKLSLSPDVRTQRACAITLYRLAHDVDAQGLLVREGGLRSVISVLTQGSEADPAARAAGTARLGQGGADSESTILAPSGSMLSTLIAMQGMDAASRAGLEVDSTWQPHAMLFSDPSHAGVDGTSVVGQRLLAPPVGADIPSILRSQAPTADELLVKGELVPGAPSSASGGITLGGTNPSLMGHATDPVVGAFFAGVLAAVSREKGSEERLVAEGAVEALVLLASRAVAPSEAEGDDTAPSADTAKAVSDRRSLLLSCAAGLYNISCAPSEGLRQRVVAGGAPGVFVRLASSDDHAMPVRRQSAAGLINLLWGSVGRRSMSHAVVKAGGVKAFTALAVDGSDSDAFACVTALHYLSLMAGSAPALVREGAVEACIALVARAASTAAKDASNGTSPGAIMALDVGQAAITTVVNLCASAGGDTREVLLSTELGEAAVACGLTAPPSLPVGSAPLMALLVAAASSCMQYIHRLSASPDVKAHAPLRFMVPPLLAAAAKSVGLALPDASGEVSAGLSSLETAVLLLDGILAVVVRCALPTPDDDMRGPAGEPVPMDVAQYAVSAASDAAHALVLSGVLPLLRGVLHLPAEHVPPATITRAAMALRALSIHDVLHAATAEMEAEAHRARAAKESLLSPLVSLVQRLTYRLGGLADDEEYAIAAAAAALGQSVPAPTGGKAAGGKLAEDEDEEEEEDSEDDYGQDEMEGSESKDADAPTPSRTDSFEDDAGGIEGALARDEAATEAKAASRAAAAATASASDGASAADKDGSAAGEEEAEDPETAAVMEDAARAVTVWEAWLAGETLSHAARVLCSMATHQVTRPALILAGAAPALIAVSDMAGVDPRLRHACLRGLCELAIARDDSVEDTTGKDITAQALAASAADQPELRKQLSTMVSQQADASLSAAVLAAGQEGEAMLSAGPLGGGRRSSGGSGESAGVAGAAAAATDSSSADVVESGAVSALVAVMGGGRGDAELMEDALDVEEAEMVDVAVGLPRPVNALVKDVPIASLGAREMHRPLGVPTEHLPSLLPMAGDAPERSRGKRKYFTLGAWLGVPLPALPTPETSEAKPKHGQAAPPAPQQPVTKATVPAPPGGSLVLDAETRVSYLPHPSALRRMAQWVSGVREAVLAEEAAAAHGDSFVPPGASEAAQGAAASADTAPDADDAAMVVGLTGQAEEEAEPGPPLLFGAVGFMRYPAFYSPSALEAHILHVKESSARKTSSLGGSGHLLGDHAFQVEEASLLAASATPLGYAVTPEALDALLVAVPDQLLHTLAPPDPNHTASVDISVLSTAGSESALPAAGASPASPASSAGKPDALRSEAPPSSVHHSEAATKKRRAARRASTGYKLNNIFHHNAAARSQVDFDISAYGASRGPLWPKLAPEDVSAADLPDERIIIVGGGDLGTSPAGLLSPGSVPASGRPSTANSIAAMAGAAHEPVSARRGKRHRSASYLSSAVAAVLLRTAVEEGREVSYHRGRAAAVAVALGSSPEAVAEEQRSGRNLSDFTSRIVGHSGGESAYALGSNSAAAAAQAIAMDVVPDGVGLDDTDYTPERRAEQTDDDFSAWVDGWGRKVFGATMDEGDEAAECNTSAEEERLAEQARLDAELGSKHGSRRSANASSWFGSSANMAAASGTSASMASAAGSDIVSGPLSNMAVSERPAHVWPGSLKWETAFLLPMEPELVRRIGVPPASPEHLEPLKALLQGDLLQQAAAHARARLEAAMAHQEAGRLTQTSSGHLVAASELEAGAPRAFDSLTGQIPPMQAVAQGVSASAAASALVTVGVAHVLVAAVLPATGIAFTEMETSAVHGRGGKTPSGRSSRAGSRSGGGNPGSSFELPPSPGTEQAPVPLDGAGAEGGAAVAQVPVRRPQPSKAAQQAQAVPTSPARKPTAPAGGPPPFSSPPAGTGGSVRGLVRSGRTVKRAVTKSASARSVPQPHAATHETVSSAMRRLEGADRKARAAAASHK